METLILSCSTGGGHNSAARAMAEELSRRGHTVTILDSYELVGERLASTVGNAYVRLVQKAPALFGVVYKLGGLYRRTPFHSPVYWANGKMVKYLRQYLQEEHFDLIICTHIFPGEILAHMRNDGLTVPPVILIATDYTCIPFTEETDSDWFVVPSQEVVKDFSKRRIKKERILPLGIPVRESFRTPMSRQEARSRLGLDPELCYLLLSGGSIGAGKIRTAIRVLARYLKRHEEVRLLVICGNNEKLFGRLRRRYARHEQITIMESTSEMAVYMRACDLFISKPGGLSSTEGAVAGIPMIHISPIPGCETKNAKFFGRRKMAVTVRDVRRRLLPAVRHLQKEEHVREMLESQRQYLDGRAAERICDLAESLV